jgi:hypothetical protein
MFCNNLVISVIVNICDIMFYHFFGFFYKMEFYYINFFFISNKKALILELYNFNKIVNFSMKFNSSFLSSLMKFANIFLTFSTIFSSIFISEYLQNFFANFILKNIGYSQE